MECVQNRPRYFAKKLMKSMKGLGTDEETLIRIVASRSEVQRQFFRGKMLVDTVDSRYLELEGTL